MAVAALLRHEIGRGLQQLRGQDNGAAWDLRQLRSGGALIALSISLVVSLSVTRSPSPSDSFSLGR